MTESMSVGIVGGGAAAVSVLSQFISQAAASACANEIAVTVITREEPVGPGLAYGTAFDSNILNMRYQKMSILPDEPDDVTRWIRRSKTLRERYPDFDADKDGFPPRSLYGMYLGDVLRDAIRKAEVAGIRLEFLQGEVVDLGEENDGVDLKLRDGSAIRVDKVVLALGNFPPTAYKHLCGTPGYFHSFWPDTKTVQSIGEADQVTILGSRLTAIDAALTILSSGHKGKVVLVSRSGLLPKVQSSLPARTDPYRESILRKVAAITDNGKTPLPLPSLIALMREEIEHAHYQQIDWDKVLNQTGAPLEILRQDIANAKKYKLNWQGVLASTSDIIENLWHMLPDSDKHDFVKKYNSIWFVYRHCMPLKNAERLLKYLESGQLEVRGGLKGVAYDPGSGKFNVDLDGTKGGTDRIQSDHLINATDVGLELDELDSALIRNLVQSAVMKASPFGGIDVDFETCRLIGGGDQTSDRLYSIGYLTKGVHFYTNDAARIACHAKRVVTDLVAQLAKAPKPLEEEVSVVAPA